MGVKPKALRFCSVEQCFGQFYGKGLCSRHYHKSDFRKQNAKRYRKKHEKKLAEYRGKAREARIDYLRSWRQANAEDIRQKRRDKYLTRKPEILARNKEWRGRNKERSKQYSREWRENNRGLHRAQRASRRAAKLRATPQWTSVIAIAEIYRGCPPGHHVDHEIPLKGEIVCGLHVPDNLQYLPAKLNMQKHNKF